ncbi:hypothetical protein AYO47_05145 [Planctomyces sp. SCGC AG-212-M04]|nr:hypothetical protein AYO47_05145 [Planctomyces sp. SCGC AG-212-M04]
MQTSAEVDMAERPARAWSDRELLSRFLRGRDESAFALIVARYGGLVMRVAQHTLRDWHAAEDAFQATFLVLARSGRRIQNRDSLAAWLHGVACRVSQRLRRTRTRRKERELPAEDLPSPVIEAAVLPDQAAALDEELAGLRDVLRGPLVLHYLEGRTVNEIARELRTSAASVKGRLQRGKQVLRKQLLKRGVLFSSALHGGSLVTNAQSHVTPTLVEATVAGGRAAATRTSLPQTARPMAVTVALQEFASMTRVALLKTSLMWAGVAGVAGLVGSGLDGLEGRAVAKAQTSGRKPAKSLPAARAESSSRSVVTTVAQLPGQDQGGGQQGDPRKAAVPAPNGTKIEVPQAAAANSAQSPRVVPPPRILSRLLKPGDERIYDALDRPVNLQLTGQAFNETMKFLAAQENITIVIDEDALKKAKVPLDHEVNLVVDNVPLRSALEMILADVNGVALDYIATDGIMKVTTRAIADATMESRIYDVRGLATTTPEQLVTAIEATVAPESWTGKGGKGSAVAIQGGILVSQSQRNHAKIASTVELLTMHSQVDLYPYGPHKYATAVDAPAVDPRKFALTGQPKLDGDENRWTVDFRKISEAERRIETALRKDVDFEFVGVELTSVMQSLAEKHGLNVKMDGEALRQANVPLNSQINLVASGLPLANALSLMFRDVAGQRLDYVIENEMLVVTTAERAKTTREMRIYDVRGITSDPQQIVPLLSRWCGPDDAKVGAGALVVTTSQPVHREILQFLEQLTEFRQVRAAYRERIEKENAKR